MCETVMRIIAAR